MLRTRALVTSIAAAAATVIAVACESTPVGPEPAPELPELRLTPVATGLGTPSHLTSPPGDPRLFVSDLNGRILVIEDGVVRPSPFLDIRSNVSREGEQGFFAVAFHPEYETNGFFFVSYTGPGGASRIERYSVSDDPNIADPASAKLILEVPQPQPAHNGGMIAFGPDGMLYASLGDGGPIENAQDPSNLLGSILRIDVDRGDPYSIPSDNPFVGSSSIRGEIWAYGLRNPWRFSFDHQEELLYIADVGWSNREEVNVVPVDGGGYNFGWPRMEGSLCFPPEQTSCDQDAFSQPTYEYPHRSVDPENGGLSIIGGYVYRGSAIPDLRGHYLFADFTGWIGSFRYSNGQVVDETRWDFEVPENVFAVSWGQDSAGELYVLYMDGSLHRIEQAE